MVGCLCVLAHGPDARAKRVVKDSQGFESILFEHKLGGC